MATEKRPKAQVLLFECHLEVLQSLFSPFRPDVFAIVPFRRSAIPSTNQINFRLADDTQSTVDLHVVLCALFFRDVGTINERVGVVRSCFHQVENISLAEQGFQGSLSMPAL